MDSFSHRGSDRTLRAVVPPEAPYRGTLVDADPPRFVVAAGDAPVEVWRAQPGRHVLAAEDVDRDDDRTVLVLARPTRALGGSTPLALSPGQAVTLAVSVLRGAAYAEELGLDRGEWWMDGCGCPLLAPGGDAPWRTASVQLLERVATGDAVAAAIDGVVVALTSGASLARRAADLEDALFSCGAPQPLTDDALRPRAVDEPAERTGMRGRSSRASPRLAAPGAGVAGPLTRLVDAEIAVRVASAVDGVRSALRGALRGAVRTAPRRGGIRARPRRRGVLVVAASVLASTLAVGMLWPDGGASTADAPVGALVDEPRAADPGDGSVAPMASGEPSPAGDGQRPPVPVESATQPMDEAAAPAATVIDALTRCLATADAACRRTLMERPDAAVPAGVATTDGPRSVALLDDLGGVEVVRVESSDGDVPAQIVVLVVADDKRLVRDVYDVADQP